MSTTTSQAASALEDYLELFDALGAMGVEFVVIGGCAVGAYARLLGETVFSNDLDLFVTHRALETVVFDGAAALGVAVRKLPVPRSVPVAVLDWKGREINLLTATDGLPPPDVEARSAREFQLGTSGTSTVLVADPFDLLRNKLQVNRPKDQPHIALLRRFLDEEAVHGFTNETTPRARIAAAERLLEVVDEQVLSSELAVRLIPLARTAADFRFLAHRLPTRAMVGELALRAPSAEIRATIDRIARGRGLPVE